MCDKKTDPVGTSQGHRERGGGKWDAPNSESKETTTKCQVLTLIGFLNKSSKKPVCLRQQGQFDSKMALEDTEELLLTLSVLISSRLRKCSYV